MKLNRDKYSLKEYLIAMARVLIGVHSEEREKVPDDKIKFPGRTSLELLASLFDTGTGCSRLATQIRWAGGSKIY